MIIVEFNIWNREKQIDFVLEQQIFDLLQLMTLVSVKIKYFKIIKNDISSVFVYISYSTFLHICILKYKYQ